MKKILALVCIMSIVLTIFVGCGNTNSNESTSLVETSQSKDSETDEDSSSGEEVTLVFWSWLPTNVQWDSMVEAFESENSGIKIDYTRTEQDDYFEKLQVAMASGTGPDLFGLTTDAKLAQYASFCDPMDALADQYIKDWKNIISETAVEQCTTEDGILAGMPMLVAGMNYMLYNKTLMDECGIEEVPSTYQEMVEATEKAKAKGYVSMAMGAADDWQNSDWFVWASNQFERGAVYEAAAGNRSFTDQCFVDTLTAWGKFFSDGVFQDGALGVATYPDARDQYFFDRKAIFFPTGSWHLGPTSTSNDEIQGTVIQTEGDILGMSIFPVVGSEGFGATTGVDVLMSVNKDCENKEAAMKFVEFMAMGQGQQMWADSLQGSPVANTITYQGAVDGELQQQSIDEINKYNTNAIGARKLSNAEIEKAIVVAMQNVAAGGDPVAELQTVQQIAESVNN